mmetsp:Transcript_31699/g.94487  ORF Transcript_31699/g.94487 Transcript_31699/m.94487 type:complete len:227 (+) Transcript_31699:3040-3720(+)
MPRLDARSSSSSTSLLKRHAFCSASFDSGHFHRPTCLVNLAHKNTPMWFASKQPQTQQKPWHHLPHHHAQLYPQHPHCLLPPIRPRRHQPPAHHLLLLRLSPRLHPHCHLPVRRLRRQAQHHPRWCCHLHLHGHLHGRQFLRRHPLPSSAHHLQASSTIHKVRMPHICSVCICWVVPRLGLPPILWLIIRDLFRAHLQGDCMEECLAPICCNLRLLCRMLRSNHRW